MTGPRPAPSFLRPEATDKTFAAQLGRGFAAALRQGGGIITLRVQPEGLGDLKIRMSMQHATVTARFEVQSRQARELLDTSLPELRSALEARGLNVDRLEVHVVRPPAQEAPTAEHRSHESAPDQDSGGAASGGDHRQPAEDPRDNAGGGLGKAWMPPEPFPRSAEPAGYARLEPVMDAETSEGGAMILRMRLDAVA